MTTPQTLQLNQFESPTHLFHEVVRSIFSRWTALELAVSNCDNSSVRDDMFETTLELSKGPTDADTYEDMFYDGFDMMGCDVEDGSPGEVAKLIVTLRDQCRQGSYEFALNVLQHNMQAAERSRQNFQSQQDSTHTEQRPYSDQENDAGAETATADMQQDNTPQIDEDGFQTVVRKTRRAKP